MARKPDDDLEISEDEYFKDDDEEEGDAEGDDGKAEDGVGDDDYPHMDVIRRAARTRADIPVASPEQIVTEEQAIQWERSVRELADSSGGILPTAEDPEFEGRQRLVRLDDPKQAETAPCETEALLNKLIEDCHFLIRELAFHSARLTPNEGARLRFLASAGQLALNGAKVGRVVAGLRNGGPMIEERRQRMIIEHVRTLATVSGNQGGGGAR